MTDLMGIINAADPFARVEFKTQQGVFVHGTTIIPVPFDLTIDAGNLKVGYRWFRPAYGETFQLYRNIVDGTETLNPPPAPVAVTDTDGKNKLEHAAFCLRFSVYNEQHVSSPKEMTINAKYAVPVFGQVIKEFLTSEKGKEFVVPVVTVHQMVPDPGGKNFVPVLSIKDYADRSIFDGAEPVAGALPPAAPQSSEEADDFSSDAA